MKGLKTMDSLNKAKGTTINELELTLAALEKLVKDKISAQPNSGYLMAKGQKNEAKIKYAQVLINLKAIRDMFGLEGAFSMGICDNCTRFDTTGFSANFGRCLMNNSTQHKFHACLSHSKINGGFGV